MVKLQSPFAQLYLARMLQLIAVGPGPMRRGNKCVEHVDLNRGYGFMKDCPAPKAAAAPKRTVRR